MILKRKLFGHNYKELGIKRVSKKIVMRFNVAILSFNSFIGFPSFIRTVLKNGRKISYMGSKMVFSTLKRLHLKRHSCTPSHTRVTENEGPIVL